MPWIMKDSAGTQIERRDQPYLTEEMKHHLEEEVLVKYPNRRAAALPVLHEIQHTYNWIPPQALEEVAAVLEISVAQLHDTASFYDDFFLRPKGRYLIGVCESISCELRGSEDVIAKLQEKLGIELGQTSDDGRFTLRTMQCLGSCGTAPCCLINDDLHENLTLENIDQKLSELE